jgi:hypothetical protein
MGGTGLDLAVYRGLLDARIDLVEGAGGCSVRVVGRLEEPAGRELLELCGSRRGVLILDLEDLVSADRAAVGILKDLRDAGARIVGASPYIAMLLNGSPNGVGTTNDSLKEDE